MRSDIDYIARTTAPESRGDFDARAARAWSAEATWLGVVTLASFTCQWRDAPMGRTQRNQWLAEFESGAEHLENPLSLANVTMPVALIVARRTGKRVGLDTATRMLGS